MNLHISSKRLKIDQANSSIMIIIAVASVLTIFALVSSKSLLSQAAYQRRVLNAKRDTIKQLKANIDNVDKLISQYKVFESQDPNLLGGSRTGQGPTDGNNSRIVLDALPSTYDFPALTSSIEKILSNQQINTRSISGTDNEASNNETVSGNPQPVAMNLAIDSDSDYNGVKTLINDLERSIRPFDIINMSLSGTESSMNISISVNTYYQPAKTLSITQKEIK